MTDFVIGDENGASGANRKARDLPEGTPVKLVELREVVSDKYTVKIKGGRRAGEEVPKVQLRATLEVLADVDEDEMADDEPAESGDRFVQYLGGVYQNDDGSLWFSPNGGAATQMRHLVAAMGKHRDLSAYEGAEGVIELERGKTGFGPYVLAFIKPEGAEDEDEPPKKSAKKSAAKSAKLAKAKAAKAKAKKPAKSAAKKGKKSAFTALPESDQEAVLEAVAEGLDEPGDLVAAEIADDEEHAEAILASLPKGK